MPASDDDWVNNVSNCLLVANNWVFRVSVKLIIAEVVYVHGECAVGEELIGKFCVVNIRRLFS